LLTVFRAAARRTLAHSTIIFIHPVFSRNNVTYARRTALDTPEKSARLSNLNLAGWPTFTRHEPALTRQFVVYFCSAAYIFL
jgi:hypothetical protein